jgi:hypothetical protein
MGAVMAGFRDQVADALRAVRVTSATSYAWFGRPVPPLEHALRSALAPPAARDYLVARLQRRLYSSFYLPGVPRPQASHAALANGADPAFVAALSGANAGAGRWDGGWSVVDVARDGTIVAQRDGLRLRMDASDCRGADGAWPAPGASLRVFGPKEARAASPGFYVARGDAGGAGDSPAVELRVYFNLTAAGAVSLLAMATRLLNERRLAFALKLVDHPAGYFRCDAGVLYLQAGDFAAARAPLRALVGDCAPHLRAETPALTKPLARGVGIGEHTAALGASFGIGRCHLVAEGIVDAHEQGLVTLADRVDAVARRFASHDLDLDRAHLVTGSRDDYVL